MGIFRDIFLSKQDKKVIDVYNDIRQYWKNTNDFIIAHVRYLQDLDYKYHLDFAEDTITGIPSFILTPLISSGLNKANSVFIFAQFVVFYILRYDNPTIYRYSDENLMEIAKNIKDILIPYTSHVAPELSFQIDKNIDVIARFGNKNISKPPIGLSNKNRVFSINRLANRIGCKPENLKQRVFEQLDSMNATIEACKEVILKHNETRFEQAKQFNMHPDDTPASIMIEFTEEYIENIKTRKKDKGQIIREMMAAYPGLVEELMHAQAMGNTRKIEEIGRQNPEFLETFLRKIADNENDDEVSFEDNVNNDLPF